MPEVLLDAIEDATRRALERHGCRPDIAAHVADAVRVAEGNGNRICGLYYLESYCRQLETGRIAGGSDETLLNTIAERILGLPQDHRPDKGVPFNQIPA